MGMRSSRGRSNNRNGCRIDPAGCDGMFDMLGRRVVGQLRSDNAETPQE
jgi:hypothetical protein